MYAGPYVLRRHLGLWPGRSQNEEPFQIVDRRNLALSVAGHHDSFHLQLFYHLRIISFNAIHPRNGCGHPDHRPLSVNQKKQCQGFMEQKGVKRGRDKQM